MIACMCMQVLQRMLRRSRAKLEHDTERLKMQDGVAHLREASLLRLLKREKTTLHSKQEYVALLINGKFAYACIVRANAQTVLFSPLSRKMCADQPKSGGVWMRTQTAATETGRVNRSGNASGFTDLTGFRDLGGMKDGGNGSTGGGECKSKSRGGKGIVRVRKDGVSTE